MPSSDFTITLNKSNDYLRGALFIHVFAVIILVKSSLPLLLIVAITLLLAPIMISIIRSRLPSPSYSKLTKHSGYWLLHKVNGQHLKYEHGSIGFDGGLFILLTLTGISSRKNIVIFKDQITAAQHRVLKLMIMVREEKN